MEDPDRAEGIFKKLIAEQKDRVDEKTLSELYLELAGIYISTGNPAKAKSVLTESIQKWGKDTQSHLVLGRIHHWLGEKEKAFKEFEIAEKLASSSDAKNTIGELYRQLGMCDNAKRLFNEALEGPATDSIIAAYVGLGHCSEGEKAIECYEKALALNMESNSSSMVFIRGKLLHSKFRQSGSIEELHEAIRFFQKAISAKPAESAYHNDVALAYMALYKETCEENVLQSAMNEYQLAEKCYRGFPSSILISNKANSYLTYVVAKQNGCEDARRGYYQRSLKEIAEGKAISTETVAFIDEAIAHFERAITLLPESKEAYEKLRLIYYGLRRFENVKRLESRASNFGIKLTPLKVSQ
jgi:tetratricopeptide (TPR) repeat protein